MAKKHKKTVVIHFERAADHGITEESVKDRKLWPKKKLIEWWTGAVGNIEVSECFGVADCQIRQITENELLRRDPDLELEHLYRKHFPELADNYSD